MSFLRKEITAYARNCLRWISSAMGIGQAGLKVDTDLDRGSGKWMHAHVVEISRVISNDDVVEQERKWKLLIVNYELRRDNIPMRLRISQWSVIPKEANFSQIIRGNAYASTSI
ncbi:hypothetical protein WAI453_011994 [Rhynchosporium graminicola]